MVGITHKNKTLRKAIAKAVVKVSKKETIDAVLENKVPKGNVFEMAKTAGLFAVKKTSDMIPDCHPLPVEYTSVNYECDDLSITILIEVHAIYRTGVEVEAMHGASVVALTIYDMLKPIDKGIEIQNIQLVEKRGGKTDWKKFVDMGISASVVVCSDTISKGVNEDKAGRIIQSKLMNIGLAEPRYHVIADEVDEIQTILKSESEITDLIIFTGGTGLSVRDVTPEALLPLLDRNIPGVEEAIRSYGQERTPLAMLSRSVVGTYKNSLVIALPGSKKGAEESMDAIFPAVLHAFKVFRGTRH